jgi:4-amino-4-deoxy-L-arabinose transferase-like glycosyltransferase
VLVAAYLRWQELTRIAGALLEPDAQDYLSYAQLMSLVTRTGFYSGEFGFREPLYIFAVKLLCAIPGYSETHLRMVSFVFSLAVVYLTYKIGREWFSPVAGFAAALIVAVHPSLISLSARGLREELFTVLLLLFMYVGFIYSPMPRFWRSLSAGLVMGGILLVRSESSAVLILLLLCYPLFNRQLWNYRMAAAAAAIGCLLLLPHLVAMNTKYGDPFAAFKHHARFYTNLEFAGQPGFPTKEEIAEKGMYTGPPISPFQYYFNYHSPWQLIKYTTIGFAKINCAMPFAFASETGNMRRIIDTFKTLPSNVTWSQCLVAGKFILVTIKKNFASYVMLGFVALTFLAGLLLLLKDRRWMMFVCLVAFQLQTAFVGYLDIDKRLTAPAYPLIALCCGYAIARVFTRFHPVSGILDICARCLTYFVTK